MRVIIRIFLGVLFLTIQGVAVSQQDSITADTTQTVISPMPEALGGTEAEGDTVAANIPPVGYTIASEGISLQSVLRGLMGLVFLLILCFIFSSNKRAVNWALVIKGVLLQILFAVLVLKVPIFKDALNWVSEGFIQILSFTRAGTSFLLKRLDTGELAPEIINFAFTILPTVIFFSALTSLLFYLGILQRVVYAIAYIMKKVMKLSGAESLAAAGNVFLGQTEAPLLIKPYIDKMTRSEVMCLMTGGMATIAGGVLASFIGFLGGDDPAQQALFATHLITASILSAPAAIVCSKLLVPETEEFDSEMRIPKDKVGANFLDAIANGTTEGLKLAVNVAGMLLVFIAFVAMFNYFLENMLGNWTGLNAEIVEVTNGRYSGLNLEFMLGYIGAPIAWMVGIPNEDMVVVGQLMGQKTVLNEFYAYVEMAKIKNGAGFVHEKSMILVTYILCGFSNFSSIGIQIGGIGSLSPAKRPMLSALGFRALLGGTVACLMTAAVAGMFY